MPGSVDAKLRGRWTAEEDALLMQLVAEHGNKNWRYIATHLPGRLAKQCRERWFNQLDPSVRRESLTEVEWRLLLEAHSKYGNHWAEIVKSGMLPGRTANQLKNHWNTRVRRRMSDSGRHRKMRAAMAAMSKSSIGSSSMSDFGEIEDEEMGEMDDRDSLSSEEGRPNSPVPRYPTRGKPGHTSKIGAASSSRVVGALGGANLPPRPTLSGLDSLTEVASMQTTVDMARRGSDRPLLPSLHSSSTSLANSSFDPSNPSLWHAQNHIASQSQFHSGTNNPNSQTAIYQHLLFLQQQQQHRQQQQQQQQQQIQALLQSGISTSDIQQLQYQQILQQYGQQFFGYGMLPGMLPSLNPLFYPAHLSALSAAQAQQPLGFGNMAQNPAVPNSDPNASSAPTDPQHTAPHSPSSPLVSNPSHNSITPSTSTEPITESSSTAAEDSGNHRVSEAVIASAATPMAVDNSKM